MSMLAKANRLLQKRSLPSFSYWYQQIPALVQKTKERGKAHCWLLSADPIIVHVVYNTHTSSLCQALQDERAYFLLSLAWSYETPAEIEVLRSWIHTQTRRSPAHRFVVLCNTPGQVDLCKEVGLRAIFCSHNCFLDERLFVIKPEIAKSYDVIYDAQLKSFKRHELATQLDNLALISYIYRPLQEQEYNEKIRHLLVDAHWFNDPFVFKPNLFADDARTLTTLQVVDCLNQCRIGLCLSRIEGAMYASVQYMLCGLPVVSTESVGGRDQFFDPAYVEVVEDTPTAVRQGVKKLLAGEISGEMVRQRTVEKLHAHRRRFIALVQEIYDETHTPKNFQSEWEQIFFHKLLKFQKVKQLIAQIKLLSGK